MHSRLLFHHTFLIKSMAIQIRTPLFPNRLYKQILSSIPQTRPTNGHRVKRLRISLRGWDKYLRWINSNPWGWWHIINNLIKLFSIYKYIILHSWLKPTLSLIIHLRMINFNRINLLIIPLHILFVRPYFNDSFKILVCPSWKMMKMFRIIIISFGHSWWYSEQFILIWPSILGYEYLLLLSICDWHFHIVRL